MANARELARLVVRIGAEIGELRQAMNTAGTVVRDGAATMAKGQEAAAQATDKTTEAIKRQTKEAADLEKQTEKVGQAAFQLGDAMGSAARIGVGVASVTAIAAAAAFEKLIGRVSEYQDMAEKTGGDPVGLSMLRTAADVGNTSVGALAEAVTRLQRNMAAGAGSEDSGINRALRAIHLNAREIQQLQPHEQLRAIGRGLSEWAAEGDRAAIVQDILGRGSADLLPTLKELGNETHRNALLTREQIEAADDYKDAQARAMSQLNQYLELLASQALPAVTGFTGAVTDLAQGLLDAEANGKALVGSNGVEEWARAGALAVAGVTDSIRKVIAYAQVASTGLSALASTGRAVASRDRALSSMPYVGLMYQAAGGGKDAAALGDVAAGGWDNLFRQLDALDAQPSLAGGLRGRYATQDAERAGRALTGWGSRPGMPEGARYGKEGGGVGSGVSEAEKQAERQRRLLAELAGVQANYMQQLADLNALRLAGNVGEAHYIELVEQLIEKQPMARALMAEEAKEAALLAKEQERLAKATMEAAKAREAHLRELDKGLDKLNADIEKEREHAAAIGLSKEAIAELTATKLEEQATSLQLQAIRVYDKQLDDVTYESTMRQVVALRTLAAAKRDTARREAAYDGDLKQAKEFENILNRADDTAGRVFSEMAANGTGAFKAIGRSIQANVIDMLYRATLRPVVIQMVGQMVGAPASMISNAIGTGGGAGNLLGLGSGLSSFSGISNGLTAWSAEGSVAGMFSNPGLYSGMELLGAAAPYLAVAAIAAKLISDATKGETRSGGHYGYNAGTGATTFLHGPSGGDPAGKEMAGLINASVATINSVFAGLGLGTRVNEFHGAYEGSEKDRGGVYTGGTLSSGSTFGESGKGSNYDGTLYELTSARTLDAAEAIKNATTDSFQVVIQAWQAEIDKLPRAVAQIIDGVDAEALSQEQAQNIIDRVTAVVNSVAQFSDAIKNLPFAEWAAATVDQRAQLLSATNGQAGSLMGQYFSNYYSAEEQRAQTVRNIQRVLAEAGANFTEGDINAGNKGKFRELTDYYSTRRDDAGVRIYGALLQVNDAFSALEPQVEAVAEAAADATDTLGTAYQAFERAMSIERDRAQAALQAAQEIRDAERDRFDVLKAGRLELQGQVESTRAWLGAQGSAFITQQLAAAQAGSYMADASKLEESIRAAINGINPDDYATQFEHDRARLVLAGKLQQLEEISGTRLSNAELAVQAAESQVKYLDDLLAEERTQTDVLENGFMTLEEALARLNARQAGSTAAGTGTTAGATAAGGAAFGAGAGSAGGYQLVTSMGLPVDLAGYAMGHLDDPAGIARYTQSVGGNMADLARALNKPLADVETWFNLQGVQSFEKGIAEVPYEMLSYLHPGETVLTAGQGADWRAGRMETDSVVRAIAAMQDQLADILERVADSSAKGAGVLAGEGGQVMQVQVVTA